ncbi:folate family ECF transporter S component [Allofustis seminis]|uniref:folate family ECF transporter S component n=1 Tax=Allofustis seminis TaxID=166939 RepID=UPI00037BDA0B|nr:folate family ECF transporter S component [Allofustis seminis]
MNKKNKFNFSVEQMTIVAVMIALHLVLSRFSIPLGNANRISFSFIITALLGILYGPIIAGLANVSSDLLKSFLFGPGGPFFIGFTISAMLGGIIYGLFLHRKTIRWPHVLAATVVNTLFVNLVLNTYWVHLLFGTPFRELLVTRVPQNAIMLPIRFAFILFITQLPQLKPIIKKYQTK